MTDPFRLVAVGGGIAGLDIASHMARAKVGGRKVQVTLIDREPAHFWKPMLHTIAAGTHDVDAQQTPYIAQAFDRGFTIERRLLRRLGAGG